MKKIITAAIEHAKNEAPNESCGLVIIYKGRKKYIPCRNININPEDGFTIHGEDYAQATDMGEIIYIVHSHPKENPKPSQGDLVAMEMDSKIPWLIVNPLTEQHTITKPSGYQAPYVDRVFSAGILDCLTIIEDYHDRELGIKMPHYERQDRWWEIEEFNYYVDLHKEAGFIKKSPDTELQEHDVIVMFSGSSKPNHAAIYLGEGKMLHHVQGRLSSIDMYGGYWQKNTWGVLRHKKLYENS